MRAGRLDRQIVIQKVLETRTTTGSFSESWQPFATVRAEYVPLLGREFLNSNEKHAEIDAVFRIRYLAGVLPKMRVSYNDVVYDIYSIVEIGRHRELELRCKLRIA